MATEIEFGTKATADSYREEHEEHLCSEDDARLKTVRFSSDAPEWLIEQAQLEAMETRGEQEHSTGQIPLSDHEKDEIDFSKARASIPHARSVKAIAREQGIDDWLAHYDPTIGVEEHRSTFEGITTSGGERMDSHEERQAQRHRDAARTAQSEQCDHARDHCQNGDPDACEFLQNACGFDQEEVEAFLNPDESEDADDGEIPGKAKGALSRSWGGYQAATGRLDSALEEVAEAWEHAQQASKAINSIRREHGQDPIHFEALEDAQAELADLVRKAAADCHECHADHADHTHDVDTGDREDLRDLAGHGADETPVGVSEHTAEAIAETSAERDEEPTIGDTHP